MTRRGNRLIGLLMAAALMAAACGSDDGGEETAVIESAEETNGDSAASDDDGAGTETTTSTAMSGDSGSTWCEQIRAAQDTDEPSPLNFDFFNMAPEEIEAQFKENLEIMRTWFEQAPPEIEDSIDTVFGAYEEFVAIGDEAGWDLNAMASDPAFQTAFDDAELTAAADAVDAYSRDVCGVDFGPGAAGSSTPAPTPGDEDSAVAAFLAQLGLTTSFLTDEQLACMNEQLADAFPDGPPAELTLDAETLELFDQAGTACGIGLD